MGLEWGVGIHRGGKEEVGEGAICERLRLLLLLRLLLRLLLVLFMLLLMLLL